MAHPPMKSDQSKVNEKVVGHFNSKLQPQTFHPCTFKQAEKVQKCLVYQTPQENNGEGYCRKKQKIVEACEKC